MRFAAKLARRLRALLARRRLDQDLDDEIRFHLEMEADALRRQGHTTGAARRGARLKFGGVEGFREATRDARGLRSVDDLVRDLKHGLRTLTRRPAFTLAMLLTLGLGVGGSAAIFGAVDGILLRPLPYPDAGRILTLWQQRSGRSDDGGEVAPANFLDWRDRAGSFATVTAIEPYGLDWVGPEGPVYLETALVFEQFFETFGTAPMLGRTPRPDEHDAGRANVLVLGHGAWMRHFGGDSAVIGRSLSIEGKSMTVIGVMPAGFAMPSDEVVWAPKVLEGWERESRLSNFYTVFGRLQDGVDRPAAEAELDAIAAQLATEHPTTNAGLGIVTVPLPERVVGGVRSALLLLLGAVGLVLAIVVANVASLQLAATAGRDREFAVRGALGAGRGRVTRQLLAENAIVAVVGTLLGFGVAGATLAGIRALAPAGLPRVTEIQADGGVLLFAALVSLTATIAAGILPVVVASRTRLQTSLAEAGRGATRGRWMSRFQSGLVITQVALSLVLVVGAGLMIRSFVTLLREDRGFRTEDVVTLTVQSWSYYPDPSARVGFVRDVADRLRTMPGVRGAGMVSAVPLMEAIGALQTVLAVEGEPSPPPGQTEPRANYTVVTPGALEALGISLRRGRYVDRGDQEGGRRVALVNESFARLHFADRNPIGRRIRLGRPRDGEPVRWTEIVGVVGDVRSSALSEQGRPAVYVAHAQAPTGANAFVIWGSGSASELLERAKRTIWSINPSIPINHAYSMGDLVGASVRDRGFVLAILAGFAVMALGLAVAGIFGLVSHSTAERTREIGVRMAFGAAPGRVAGLVLGQAGRLATIGIAIGLAGAALLTRAVSGMLYRVAALDPITFGAAGLTLLGAALLAAWLPARRASRTDPVAALRS